VCAKKRKAASPQTVKKVIRERQLSDKLEDYMILNSFFSFKDKVLQRLVDPIAETRHMAMTC
jgi:hypothetical protein